MSEDIAKRFLFNNDETGRFIVKKENRIMSIVMKSDDEQ